VTHSRKGNCPEFSEGKCSNRPLADFHTRRSEWPVRAQSGSALALMIADAAEKSIKTSAAPQQQKRPLVQGAASFPSPMSELRTKLTLVDFQFAFSVDVSNQVLEAHHATGLS
jgi:hypothetical protein